MRTLLSILGAVALALTSGACDELPQEPAETDGPEIRASGGTSPGNSGMLSEPTWGNDHLWRFLIPKSVPARMTNSEGAMVFGHPSNEDATKPLYQIGPDAGDDGPHHALPVPHDHVTTVPGKNKGRSGGICHLKAVFPAPGAEEGVDVATSGPVIPPLVDVLPVPYQAHAADIDGDDKPEDLTSAEKVQEAEDRGHLFLVSTPLVFPCPLKNIEG